ncbi:MAG: redoxin family protein [Lachnospiraceae bacterium]|nr:redoxin family protein [Lachnospiraceae bacterium]
MIEKLISWWNSHRPTKRRLIQLYSALLYNAHLKGFITGEIYSGKLKALCVPGFNCYSCPGAVGACPLGSLQAALSSSGKQIGFYIIGILLLYGLIAGRTICGWFCPLGLIQELLHKIPTPKIPKSRITRILSYLKYVFLVIFVFIITLWYGLKHDMAVPAFCKYICPAGTFEGAMGLLSNPNNSSYFGMLGIYFTRKFIFMLLIGGLCIFCYRAFCRFICPLGAIYGMFNSLSVIGIKVDFDRCRGCGACVRNCKMDVKRVGDHECIHCGQCIQKCGFGAITMKAGNFELMSTSASDENNTPDITEKRRKIEKYAWRTALIILALLLIWVNLIDPSGRKKKSVAKDNTPSENVISHQEEISETDGSEETAQNLFESSAPLGFEVGQQLPDFTTECFDGTVFKLSENRGKVVVINLWATWCGPCVKELPYFNDFRHEHADDAIVLACHSSNAPEDVPDFLSDKDWNLLFTIDNDENRIFEITNGSGVLPQTIVLNRRGEVIYNEIRSVTPDMLEQLYKQASENETSETTSVGSGSDLTEVQGTQDNDDFEISSDTDGSTVSETGDSAELSETGDSAELSETGEPAELSENLETSTFGYKEGDTLRDFSTQCLDGKPFRLSESRGRITIINLWASYSEDSLKGLNELNDLYKENKDDISVIAVHNHFGSEKVPDNVRDLDIPVAIDNSDERIFKLCGGSMAVPRTLIVDKDGKIVYNRRGCLTREELEDLISSYVIN